MSAPKFEVPNWAATPNGTLRFDVMKEGARIETVDMGKIQCFRIGRQEGNDLVLDHLSISRQHAVLVHGTADGPLGATLFDLGSAHGTVRINAFGKEKLQPNVGLVLKEGDIIVFGASTRQYQLAGVSTAARRSRSPVRRKTSRSHSPKSKPKAAPEAPQPFVPPAQFRQNLAMPTKVFASGGILPPDTEEVEPQAPTARRKSASAAWHESAAAGFGGDDKRTAKFLKLMGDTKGSATTGFEKRVRDSNDREV